MKKTYAIATLLVTTLASFVQAAPNTTELTGDLAAVYLNQPVAVEAGTPYYGRMLFGAPGRAQRRS